MADSYFLPPAVLVTPPPERTPQVTSPRWRMFTRYLQGSDILIDGVTYQGAHWNGPLSAAQIAAITAAGHGARIFAVDDLIEFPADIDS